MVWDLIRDSTFGHLVRLGSGGKWFQYAEEKDTSLWKKYVNEKKSGFMSHHGNTNPPENGSEEAFANIQGIRTREAASSETSSQTWPPNNEFTYNEASGMKVDPEKGKDRSVIDWYGPEDPDVCT